MLGARASSMRGRAAVTREGGQSTVELALCLPLAALVLASVVEVGMLAVDQARLWHAAREAARAAVVDPDPAAARRAAERVGLGDLEVSVTPEATYRVQGRPLTVAMTYSPSARIPLLDPVVERLQLRARATMRIEQP